MASRDTNQEIENLIRAGNLTKEQIALLKKLQAENRKTIKATEETTEAFGEMQEGLDNVGENFGLRLGSMFQKIQVEVEQTTRDISTMFSDLETSAPEIAANISAEFNDSFRSALPDPKDIQAQINLNSLISEFKSSFPEMGNEMQKAFKTGDIATFYRKFGDEGMKNLQNFMKDKKGFGGMKDWLKPGGQGEKSAINFRQQLESFEPAAQKTTKVIFNWGSLFKQIGSNLLNYMNLRSIIDHIMEFDNKLSNIKREFGVPVQGFAKADAAMQGMVKKGTQFGLTMDQSFGLVKNLAEEARTNNIQNVAETAKALAAIPQATGIAVETVGDIAGKMMFFGANAERAKHAFTSIQQSANRFGVNVTKVGKVFADVFPKYARMGFKGGEESLAKMAAKAEKMGMDLGKTLDMSDKFLDLNTALEASADLSLLGGAASQVSFTDLMRAAEEGGDALIDITGRMTSDIGKIGSDGLIKFTGMDRRRLKGIAEATGQDVEQLTNQLTSKLQDQAKKAALPPGVFNSLSDEEKDFLMSKMVNKGGKWKFEGLNGIQDLKGIGRNSIQAQMNAGKTEALNAEKRAKATQSFQETMTAFIQGLHNEMLAFRPILDQMKKIFGILQRGLDGFQKFIGNIFGAKAAVWAKPMLLLTTVLMLTFGPAAMARFFGGLFRAFTAPVKMLSGLGSKLSSAFKGGAGKKAAESLVPSSKMATPTSVPGKQTGMGGFTRSLPNPAQILAVAAAIVALGLALLMIGKGIQLAANGFANLVRAFNESRNAGMALAAIGVVMGGFVAMLYLMVGAVAALAAAGTAGAVGLLALGASLLMVGGGIYFAAKGFSMLVTSFMQLGKYSGSLFRAAAGMVTIGGALLLISPALLVFGAASLIAVPGMIAFGYLLRGLAAAKGINPKIISQVGDSMGSIAWGLVKLGLAAGPAVLAMVSATSLMVVAVALKNISAVDVKKISQFGQSLGAISGTMIKGLIKLGAIAPYAVLAMVSAGSIWAISQALSRIKVINLKSLQNFGESMGLVSEKMMWGLIKLGAISPFVVLGIVSAGGIWAISKALGSISIVDTKKIEAFGMSLGAVSAAMIFGLIKLGAISPFVALGVVSAGGINLISRLLKNIPLINTKTLSANASALSSASGTYAKAFIKLIPVAALTPLALLAAGGIWGVTKMLKAVPSLNEKSLKQAASVVSSIAWPFVKSFFKLQAVGALTPLALLAAVGILGVTKALSVVPKLNPAFLILTATVLNQVSGPFGKALFKLGLLGVFAPTALVAAASILGITVILNKITPLKAPVLMMAAATLAVVSGPFAKGLLKLGLAGFFAPLAMIASIGILAITKILNKITPLKAGVLIGAANVISIIAGPLAKGLFKLGLVSVLTGPAVIAAYGLLSITKSLSKVSPVSPLKLMTAAQSISMSSGIFSKGLLKLGLLSMLTGSAVKAASGIMMVTKLLSKIAPLNPVTLKITSMVLTNVSEPFAKSLKKLGSLAIFTGPAVVAALGIMMVTRLLSRVAPLNPVTLIMTSSILSKVSFPFSKSLAKLGSLAIFTGPAILAAIGILSVTRILKSVPMLDPITLIMTSSILSRVSWPFSKSLAKLGSLAIFTVPAIVAAAGILAVTKILKSVPLLNPVFLIMTSKVLSIISFPFAKSMAKIATVSVFVAPAVVAAAGILVVTKTLKSVPFLNPAVLLITASVLSKIAWPFTTSLGLLAPAAVAVVPAMAAALGILGVTQTLKNIPFLNPATLLTTASVLSKIAWPFTVSMGKLAPTVATAGPAYLAAKGILEVTKALFGVPALDSAKLLNASSVLSKIAKPFFWSLGKLGASILQVAPAIGVAAGINQISKYLATVSTIKEKALITLSDTLSNVSKPFFFSLGKLAGSAFTILPAIGVARGINQITKYFASTTPIDVNKLTNIALSLSMTTPMLKKSFGALASMGLVIIPAIAAALGLVKITNILKSAIPLDFKKMSNIAYTLSSTSGRIAKGLAKLALVGFYAIPAIAATASLAVVTTLLNKSSYISYRKMSNIGFTLNNTAGPIAKGLAKLSLVSLVAIPAIAAAKSISVVTKFLNTSSDLSYKKLSNIGFTLNSTSGAIAKGLAKLALVGFVAIPAVAAAASLVVVTRLLNLSSNLDMKKMSNIGLTLNNTSGPIAKGLAKLALVGVFTLPAIIASTGLIVVTKLLSKTTSIDFKKMFNIGFVLNSTAGSILKGLIKFSGISLFVLPAIAASAGVMKISTFLSRVSLVSGEKLIKLGSALSSSAGKLFMGLMKFSGISILTVPAIAGSIGLVTITKLLNLASPINLVKLVTIGTAINSASGPIAKGLLKLGLAGTFAIPAITAATSLVLITKLLKSTSDVNFKLLSNVGNTLNSVSGPITKGLLKLSTAGLFILPAIIAAKGIATVSNILKNISPINSKTLTNIGTSLTSSGSSLSSGVRKIGFASIFIIPAIIAAKGLVTISKLINQILPINSKNLASIGTVLNSNASNVFKGVIKLGSSNILLLPAIIAAKLLVVLSKIINQIPVTLSKGLSSIGSVINKESGQIFKGLIKLSSINLAILPAIIAAKSLVKLSKILSSVQQIQVKNLSSISTSLSSTSTPILKSLLKFATITFAIAPAILTAYGLRKLSRILLSIAIIDSKPIVGLAETLSASGKNMLTAITLWSVITPFIVPAIIAAAGVSRIFRSLAAVSRLDLKGLAISAPILGGLTPTLLKFSSIGLVAPLLFSASLALATLGRSLQKASIGFVTFASIPWTIIGTALPTLNGLLSTLINFGFKGLLAAPGILAMAATFGVLGRSLTGLSSNFALSTQSMSNYSKESERLKTVANAPKPVITDQTNRLKQSAIAQPTVNRTENVAGRTGANNVGGGNSGGGVQVVQIKPIQIDLKLNGRQLQQLIVEANYNRT